MRTILSILASLALMLLPSIHMAAQHGNYVCTEVMLDGNGTRSIDNVQFLDGLGRPTASATNGLGGQGRYTYTARTYRWGEVCDQWLPAVGTDAVDEPATSGVAALSAATYGDGSAFSHTEHDALGRTQSILGPGEAWHKRGKAVTTTHTTNTAGSVRRYTVDGKGKLVDNGHYTARSLSCTLTTDEDGHTLAVYSDPLGHKLLERRGEDNDTYYIYDDLGQLRFVLTPQYQHEEDTDLYAYEYRYDGRGNIVWKRLPGCEPVQYWRDRGDRVVREQDGMLRQRGLCRFFLYDGLGRLSRQGVTRLVRGEERADTTLEKTFHYDTYDFIRLPAFHANAPLRTLCDSIPKACASSLPTGMMELTNRGDTLLTVWAYDKHGNRTAELRTLPGGTLLTTRTDYSFTRKPVRVVQTLRRGGKESTAVMDIAYNAHNDQPGKTTLTIDGGTPTVVEETVYNDIGQVESIRQASGSIATSNAYNVRGWTTAINGTGLNELLSYHNGTGTPCYNGDISTLRWRTANDSTMRGYQFSYDTLDRLTASLYGEGATLTARQGRYNEIIKGYTANGTITGLVRNGRTDSGYGQTDNLTYTLDGNRLERVDDAAAPVLHSGALDFTDNTVETDGAEYAYNANGALTMDANRGITCIEYDNANHPVLIQFADGSRTEYVYTASGEKLRTIHRTAVRDITVGLGEVRELTRKETLSLDSTDYCGSFTVENGRMAKYLFGSGYYSYRHPRFDISLQPGQQVIADSTTAFPRTASKAATTSTAVPSGSISLSVHTAVSELVNTVPAAYHYYAKDHLGNIRAVLSASGKVEQATHYYPFGAVIADISTNASLQKHKYSGKELDLMHGLNTYDFGTRQYDPLLGVWRSVDRFAEKYYRLSPYSFCSNNPLTNTDVNGDSIWILYKKNSYLYHSGEVYLNGKNVPKPKGFLEKARKALNTIAGTDPGNDMLSALEDSEYNFKIVQTQSRGEFGEQSNHFCAESRNYASIRLVVTPSNVSFRVGSGGTVFWNSYKLSGGPDEHGKNTRLPVIGLAHELGHAYSALQGILNYSYYDSNAEPPLNTVTMDERNAMHFENLIRYELGYPLRKAYTRDSNGNLFFLYQNPY